MDMIAEALKFLGIGFVILGAGLFILDVVVSYFDYKKDKCMRGGGTTAE